MATIFDSSRVRRGSPTLMMLDFAAILIGYGFERAEAREIAVRAVQLAREHAAATPGVLRRSRL